MRNVDLVPVAEIEKARADIKKHGEALTTYFGDLLNADRPVFPRVDVEGDPAALLDELRAVRAKLAMAVPVAQEAVPEWTENSSGHFMVGVVRLIKIAGVNVSKADIEHGRQNEQRFLDTTNRTRVPIDEAVALAVRRMELGLALIPKPAVAEDDLLPPADALGDLKATLRAMEQASGAIGELKNLVAQMHVLLAVMGGNHGNENFGQAVLARTRKQYEVLETIRMHLRGVSYPFAEVGREISLDFFVVPQPANPNEVGETAEAAANALSQCSLVYLRSMAALAQRCETLETELGLEKMAFAEIPEKEEA
jgi:hypothetical protein